MRVVRTLRELSRRLPSPVVTVGNFDGVHRGHQSIFSTLVREARARRGVAIAVTFDPHPAKVLAGRQAPPLLTTLEQRLNFLRAAKIDITVILKFDSKLSRVSPRAFVERILLGRLNAQVVCVGKNFRFGHEQAGDVALLKELGKELSFTVCPVAPVDAGRRPISSSLIRRLLAQGEVDRAARCLGRPFAVTGEIERGAGRGVPLGFPTLNITPEQECVPARGVYVTETLLEGRLYPSATNVGVNPTFDGTRLLVETYLLDFSRTVARGPLEVRFHRRLRDEIKFPSAGALQEAMAGDVQRTRRFFARRRRPGRARR